jgi:hypothetical protein
LKIGNVDNFHLDFAYLIDFLRQPEDRPNWTNSSVTIDNKSPYTIINSGVWTHKVDRERAVLLQSIDNYKGNVYEQTFTFVLFRYARQKKH